MNFRKREEVAKNPAVSKVLPDEANRARYSDKELKEFMISYQGSLMMQDMS